MTPLSRPPIGPRRVEAASDRSSSPPSSSAVERFFDEARGFLDDADVPRMLWGATRLLPPFTFPRTRARLLAALGCDMRRGTAVMGHVYLVGPRGAEANLRVGAGCMIGPDVILSLDAPITLGKNVSLGPRVMLYTATHPLGDTGRRMRLDMVPRPIVIEDGAWIGLGAIVLAGVRVGRGAVVTAGSVVHKDVPENALVSGNPATVVETLPSLTIAAQ
jgi:maltose O-acetyltransferase